MKVSFYATILVLSILLLPQWITICLLFFGLIYLNAYGAVIGGAFLYDIFYFGGFFHSNAPFLFMVPLSIYALLFVLILFRLRRYIREELV